MQSVRPPPVFSREKYSPMRQPKTWCCNELTGKAVREHSCGPVDYEEETLVGAVGFEPTTFWSQTRRATGLRYAPIQNVLQYIRSNPKIKRIL